jgi:hypothetical protein
VMGQPRTARVVLAVAGMLLVGAPIVVVAASLIALANGTAAVVAGGTANLPDTVRTIYPSHPILDLWPVPLGVVALLGGVALGRGTIVGWRLGMLGTAAVAAFGASQLPSQVSQMLAAAPDERGLPLINVALVSAIVGVGLVAAWDVWSARAASSPSPATR